MQLWEVFVIGAGLAMDAVAVSLTDGMTEPKMRVGKMLLIAGAFAFFQFFMPLVGYACGYAFFSLVQKIAPYLSFALLALIGGKMIFDSARELMQRRKGKAEPPRGTGAFALLGQAVATSVDALAVGVTLLAAKTQGELPAHVLVCALIIGLVTLVLSLGALAVGKKAGDRFADKAGFFGGAVLLLIGLKILLEGVL